MGRVLRVFADESGDTHLTEIELPPCQGVFENPPKMVGINDIPATTLTIVDVQERLPDKDFHPAPRRQLVVVLRGTLEITTRSGDRERITVGDCLLADDMGSRGHLTRDVGDVPLASVTVGIDPAWVAPDAAL